MRCRVDHNFMTLDSAINCREIGNVTDRVFDFQILDKRNVRSGAVKGGDLIPIGDEPLAHMRANKAGRARDEDFHLSRYGIQLCAQAPLTESEDCTCGCVTERVRERLRGAKNSVGALCVFQNSLSVYQILLEELRKV